MAARRFFSRSSTTTPGCCLDVGRPSARTPCGSRPCCATALPPVASRTRSTSTTMAMIDKQLQRACACLGIRVVHSRPGQPDGRGKFEKLFRTVREQFLVEIGSGRELADMTQLNTLFTAWVWTVYHRRRHSETGQSPPERWSVISPRLPSVAQLRDAFLWSAWRNVTNRNSRASRQQVRSRRRAGRPQGRVGVRSAITSSPLRCPAVMRRGNLSCRAVNARTTVATAELVATISDSRTAIRAARWTALGAWCAAPSRRERRCGPMRRVARRIFPLSMPTAHGFRSRGVR
jgi:hypothetical protein